MSFYIRKVIPVAILNLVITSIVQPMYVSANDAKIDAQGIEFPFPDVIYKTPVWTVNKQNFFDAPGIKNLPEEVKNKFPDATFGGVFIQPGHHPIAQDSMCAMVCFKNAEGKEVCLTQCGSK
ncbi:MAG: hypothetical protein F4206_13385 [Gammaproteobacteria bacterium]|nr:hypothetical protein [Gammaproteobacteria bacterium]